MHKLILTTGVALVLAGCTTTGNTEKGAVIGAATGAAAGAIIGNNTGSGDAGTGAIIGGVVGAVGGGMIGREKDKNMGEPTQMKQGAAGQTLYFDQERGRYYFIEEATGKTYWQDGTLRSQ